MQQHNIASHVQVSNSALQVNSAKLDKNAASYKVVETKGDVFQQQQVVSSQMIFGIS